jgi:hypothetical protein
MFLMAGSVLTKNGFTCSSHFPNCVCNITWIHYESESWIGEDLKEAVMAYKDTFWYLPAVTAKTHDMQQDVKNLHLYDRCTLLHLIWRQQVPPKRRYLSPELHGVTSYKTVLSNGFVYWDASDWWLWRRGRRVAVAIIMMMMIIIIIK